jgi:DNA/RNA-binding domain of Phe-tRNA-synthetase-like protein
VSEEPEIRRGLVAPTVAAEHPGLWLAWTEVETVPGRTPAALHERLRRMADRMHGAEAIAMRRREVPHAYRVFFRHVGLDPDVDRTPVEAVVLRRMSEGGLRPRGLIADALTVAVLETGVGVQAFDAAAVVGAPRIGEAGGRLVLADEQGPLAVLFGEPEPRAAPTKATRRLALLAVAVPGVADLFVHEALWTAWDILS